MISFLIMLPLLIVLVTLVNTIARNIVQVWLDHRVKMALLEKLEHKPELLNSFQELQELLEGNSTDPEAERSQNFILTGVILAVIGAIFVILYGTLGGDRWAVGAYWGGVACVALGFILTMMGILIRFLSRPPQ